VKTIEEIRAAADFLFRSCAGNPHMQAVTITRAIDELAELRALTRCRYTIAPYSLAGRCSLREGHTGECK
jgi:hypothetical protein